jgi:TP901 family phage tail tape measure protein
MAEDLKVSLTITAIDRITAVMRKITRAFTAVTKGFQNIITKARAAGVAINQYMKEVSASPMMQFAANLNQAASAVTLVGQKLRSALAAPIEVAQNFEQQMAEVRGIMDPSAADFARLTKEAEHLGFTIGEFTMQDAAEGMAVMARASRDTNEILAGLPPILDLSTAASMDFRETTNTVLGIMGGYNKTAEETQHVTDVLTAVFTGSKVTLQQLGDTFRYAAATAGKAGVSFEDTAVIAGLLGNSSIDASMAGTTLAQMINGLVAPSDRAIKVLDDLNVKVKDETTGALRRPVEIMQDFGDAMDEMSMGKVDRLKALDAVFGIRGLKGAATILDNLGPKLEKLSRQVDESAGRTKELATAMRETSKNLSLQMSSAIEATSKKIGDLLLPALNILYDVVIQVANGVAYFVQEFPLLSKVIIIGVGVLALLTTALGAFMFALVPVVSFLAFVTVPTFMAAAAAVGAFLAPLLFIGAAVAVLVAIAGAAYLLTFRFDETKKMLLELLWTFGLSRDKAEEWASTIMFLAEVMLAPVIALINGVKALIELMENPALHLRSAGSFLLPGLVDAPGAAEEESPIGGASVRERSVSVGGLLDIKVNTTTGEVQTEVTKDGVLDFAVDVGRDVLGF